MSRAWKPAVVEDRIEPRQMLNLTVAFDHELYELIDGASATRFVRRLVELIEGGFGLDEDRAVSTIGNQPIGIEIA